MRHDKILRSFNLVLVQQCTHALQATFHFFPLNDYYCFINFDFSLQFKKKKKKKSNGFDMIYLGLIIFTSQKPAILTRVDVYVCMCLYAPLHSLNHSSSSSALFLSCQGQMSGQHSRGRHIRMVERLDKSDQCISID